MIYWKQGGLRMRYVVLKLLGSYGNISEVLSIHKSRERALKVRDSHYRRNNIPLSAETYQYANFDEKTFPGCVDKIKKGSLITLSKTAPFVYSICLEEL
jgi:hypothetical protein